MILLLALIRIIPYGIAAARAWTKGYPWLTAACVFLIASALVNYIFNTPPEFRVVLAGIVAVFLMIHSGDLPNRNKRDE